MISGLWSNFPSTIRFWKGDYLPISGGWQMIESTENDDALETTLCDKLEFFELNSSDGPSCNVW